MFNYKCKSLFLSCIFANSFMFIYTKYIEAVDTRAITSCL